jgi:hypothetical protein
MLWLAATPTPTPTPGLSADMVTPGVEGFLVMAIIAVVIVLLGIAMLRRVRRAQYRFDVREQLDAEEAAARGEGPEAPEVRPESPTKD